MKLLVIVLCLVSERYFMHMNAKNRIQLLDIYLNLFHLRGKKSYLTYPWLILMLLVFPIILFAGIFFYLFESWLFGFVGLLFHIIIFYFCMGPVNPFYPGVTSVSKKHIGDYFCQVNGQLFSVIFWYLVTGPIGILIYRLISYSQKNDAVKKQARQLTDLFDWLPARFTVLFYLLVGNFQAGYKTFLGCFFSTPENNQAMLSECGLKAAGFEKDSLSIAHAELIVEHAVILNLVFIALFTMLAWL